MIEDAGNPNPKKDYITLRQISILSPDRPTPITNETPPIDMSGAAFSTSKPHVLAVDDSHLDRLLVANLLRQSSCTVTMVENGMKALEYLGIGNSEREETSSQATPVNLILSDYCMPGITGYQLLKKIKESSHVKEIPVVIMSSESVPAIIQQCLDEGAQMFIKKPLKLSDVEMLRRRVLNR